MKLELLPKLAQQQTLSPKLMISMRMLPLTVTELELQIERELEENPALEIAPESAEVTASLHDDVLMGRLRLFQPFQDRSGGARPDADESDDYLAGVAAPEGGLAAHLEAQLQLLELPSGVRRAAEEFIGNLDWRGYFVAPVEELRAQFPPHLRADFDAGLAAVRGLDPAGVGAESLIDCLLLQCQRGEKRHPLAERILQEQFGLLLHNRLPQLAHVLGVTLAEVQEAVEHIRGCTPHPGAAFSNEDARAITPDVTIEEGTRGYKVRVIDDGVPRLQLSEQCRELLGRADLAAEVAQYLRKKIEAAQWLIQALDGRRKTLQHIAETVLEFQQAFMAEGPSSLRPLNMRTVAEAVGVHISTVSRAIKGKHIQTPWGIFPLRFFFEGGVERGEGELASKRSLKERIADMIARENKQAPLSDGEIAAKLHAQGFSISRRTVSKYRTSARIPPGPMRKEFAA